MLYEEEPRRPLPAISAENASTRNPGDAYAISQETLTAIHIVSKFTHASGTTCDVPQLYKPS